MRKAKKKPVMRKALIEDVPDEYRTVVEQAMKRISSRDLARIVDPKVPMADLVREYHEKFHAFSITDEVADYDALVTDEWRRVTQGKTDTDR